MHLHKITKQDLLLDPCTKRLHKHITYDDIIIFFTEYQEYQRNFNTFHEYAIRHRFFASSIDEAITQTQRLIQITYDDILIIKRIILSVNPVTCEFVLHSRAHACADSFIQLLMNWTYVMSASLFRTLPLLCHDRFE